jgi:hypothetical protein
MAYTSSVAEVRSSKDNAGDLIDIGHVSKEATRWWMAVLAPNQG